MEIRQAEASDAEGVRALYACPNAYSGTLQLPHPSLAMWEKRLSQIPDNVYAYVAIIDNEIVGNLGLEVNPTPRRRHVASFGMGVKDNYQGQGVGGALLSTALDLADNWLNLKRVELTVFTDNDKAIALYEKFGFINEGKSEAYALRNGEYVSAYHMARVR